jgi:hypothetical protein
MEVNRKLVGCAAFEKKLAGDGMRWPVMLSIVVAQIG